MFFMAYSLQPTVAVNTTFWRGNEPLDQEKGRRALRRRPCPATAGSRGRFRCFSLCVYRYTEHLAGAITRGYGVIILR
jgi:hypothetical protein